MTGDLVPVTAPQPLPQVAAAVPALFAAAGDKGAWRFVEFFTAEVRNPNTRRAYARAVGHFPAWCRRRHYRLEGLTPVHAAAYVEEPGREPAKPSVKQSLAALRMLTLDEIERIQI